MKRNSNYFLRQIGDTFFLQSSEELAQRQRKMVFLNSTGAFIWNRMAVNVTVSELVNALISEYDVQADIVEGDVQAFISFLRANGCLEQEE